MSLKTLFFGSIGTLCDTSELQLAAFNQAFRNAGLDWHWDKTLYQELLLVPGGENRIRRFARTRGEDLGGEPRVRAIYEDKTALFRQSMADGQAQFRPGVARLVGECREAGLSVALVSTTDRAVIDEMFSGAGGAIAPSDFELIVDRSQVDSVKPAVDAWVYALDKLGRVASECIAMEDTVVCLDSAVAAGIPCIATPNVFSRGNAFDNAVAIVSDLGDESCDAMQLAGRRIVSDGRVSLEGLRQAHTAALSEVDTSA